MPRDVRIAILMTCHNRKELTRACLVALKRQVTTILFDVYLVDDGSTDGTAEVVRAELPSIHIIKGTGDLWWNGGMSLAWKHAKETLVDYDAYLWLNDDVLLFPTAVESLWCDLAQVKETTSNAKSIIVGSTIDPATTRMSYGGQLIREKLRPLRMVLAEPQGVPSPVQTMSGNCVLITKQAEERLGNLNPAFKHIFGDLDYGLRAVQMGVNVYASSNHVGSCAANNIGGSSLDGKFTRFYRIKQRIREEKRVHARDWRVFVKLHSGLGPLSLLYSVAPYLRILMNR